jgi:transposase-like protein
MEKQRRQFSSEEKVQALRRHLIEKVAVPDVCEALGIKPTQFYRWQQTFFENGVAAFERSPGQSQSSSQEDRIAFLEAKLKRKDEVLGELLEEHVALKKKQTGGI